MDFAQAARELGRKGVTRQLLWEQYCGQGYARSCAQFCRDLKTWRERQRVTMRQSHAPGDTTFVDFGGLADLPHGDGGVFRGLRRWLCLTISRAQSAARAGMIPM